MVRGRTRAVRALVMGLATISLVTGGGGVRADTHLGGAGSVGAHALRDSAAFPGVTCTYLEPAVFLDRMRVRPPRVWARDVTAARDQQAVSWAITVQYWDVNEFWATASTHGPWKATAWDDTPAAFSARSFDAPTGMGGTYRVVVTLRWHRGGLVEGRSRHLVDWVRRAVDDRAWTVGPAGTCPEQLVD